MGMAMRNSCDCAQHESDIILGKDIRYIEQAIVQGRCFFENIRKFVQYQLIGSINVMLYSLIGALLFEEWPMQPLILLFINFIIDFFACHLLSFELPSTNVQSVL